MKIASIIPFALEPDDFKFEPNKYIEELSGIDDRQRSVLTTIDVMEQREDKMVRVICLHRLIIILLLVVNIPQIYIYLQHMGWIKP